MTSVRQDGGVGTGSLPPRSASPAETVPSLPPARLGVYADVPKEVQARLGKELRDLFARDTSFSPNKFSVDSPWIARTLDAGWQEQVIIDAEAAAVEAYANATADSFESARAFQHATYKGCELALAHRDSIADLWNRADNSGIVVGYGSARTEAIRAFGNDLRLLMQEFGDACVRRGISNGNGAAETGAMGMQSEVWHDALQRLKPTETPARIYHAFLGLFPKDPAAHREPPSMLAQPEHRSQPLRSFLNRTTFLMSLGDQRVNLVLPGGVGTFEEVARVMAEIKKSDDVNGPYTARKAPHVYLLNIRRPGETVGCYDELKALWQNAVETGAMKPEDLENVHWIEDISTPEARATVIQSMLAHYEGVGDAAAWMAFNGRWNGEDLKVARAAVDLVEALPGFTDRRFIAKSDHLRIFDAMYQAQVTAELAEHAVHIAAESRTQGNAPQVARAEATEWVRARALRWRESASKLIERLHERDVLTIIGSAKEDVWDESLQRDLKTRVVAAVQAGMPVILGGDGREGISRRAFELWVDAKKGYRAETGSDSPSEFVRAEFKLSHELREKRTLEGYSETLSPPLTSVLLRSELLLVLGGKRDFVVYPGGLCELEVAARAILGKQLNGVVDTYCTRQGADQKITFVSASKDKCQDFFRPLQGFLDELVRIKTVSAPDLEGVQFTVAGG